MCLPALGFEEDLVTVFFGEPDNLVFDRRAVARPSCFDLATVHRSPMQVVANQLMDRRRGLGQPAVPLWPIDRSGQETEGLGIHVAGLLLESFEVDRLPVQSRWRPGLESLQFEAQPGEAI